MFRLAHGLPPVGGRPRREPDELIPAIRDLGLDRRRSLSWIADRLLETKYKDQEDKSKPKLERRIAASLDFLGYMLAANLDFAGYILKVRPPVVDDCRSHRDRALDYLAELSSHQQTSD